jgi:maltokinase
MGLVDPIRKAPYLPGDPVFEGAAPISGEQTNTCIRIPNLKLPEAPAGLMLKILREPAPLPNPEVEIPQGLYQAGYRQVPKVINFLEQPEAGCEPLLTAIVTELIPNADDGFELACQKANLNLDFTVAAAELGVTIANLHLGLRDVFGTTPLQEVEFLVTGLRQRAEVAFSQVPFLLRYENAVQGFYKALAQHLNSEPPRTLQRIHGDLHLGQTLYQPSKNQWFVLDFEGEPERPLAQRSKPDLPERDVAGIIRSIGYATGFESISSSLSSAGEVSLTASTWEALTAEAFLSAYQSILPVDPLVLKALMIDKALYEAVYESRNRPDWLPIPLQALADFFDE